MRKSTTKGFTPTDYVYVNPKPIRFKVYICLITKYRRYDVSYAKEPQTTMYLIEESKRGDFRSYYQAAN